MNFDRQVVNYVNETSLGKDLSKDLSEGKTSWTGITDKKQKVKMGQEKTGIYYGEISDEFGKTESATTAKTKQDIDKWFDEQGIKKIKWNK